MSLRRPRQLGACWLGCELWHQLGLDAFWRGRVPASREGTRWDQPFDVFKHESTRLNFSDDSCRPGEKVTPVSHGPVFAANGKRLAVRAARHQIRASLPCVEVLVVDTAFNQRPMPDKVITTTLVCPDRFASIMIVFENSIMFKTRVRGGMRKSSCSGEKPHAT